MINLDKLDPDWQFATKHGKASLIGMAPIGKSQISKSEICPCCFQFVYKDPIPICTNPKQLQFLGFGFPLFYIFLKNCMIMLLITICSYNAISLKKAFDFNYTLCHGQPATTPQTPIVHRLLTISSAAGGCFTFMIEMARNEPEVTSEEEVLRITSFIIQMLFLIYMRDHICKLDAYYDERDIMLSDYSIMLKKIPKQPQIQSKLHQFFLKQFTKPYPVKKITLLPEYSQIDQLTSDRQKAITRLRKAYKKQKFDSQFEKDQAYVEKIDQAIVEEIMASNQLAKRDQLQCEKAILVFNSQHQREEVIEQFEKMNFSVKGPYFGVGSQKITIKIAPEPKQIIWKNVNIPHQIKIFLYIGAWILSLIVLAVVTVATYFIYDYKASNLIDALTDYSLHPDQKKYQDRYKRAISIVYFALLFIILFNKLVMSTLYHKLTDIERHETRSKFEFFFGLRYAIGLFFTTALMTLIVEALVFKNYDDHPYGVIQEETLMFFFNALFVPIYWLINPFNLAKKFSRYLNYGKKHLTQAQANTLMQQSQYEMGKRYAQIIETMWFTFLYSTLVPIGAVVSLAGFALYYWVDKYTLLRRSSLGGEISGHVVLASMKLLDFTLFLKPLGQLIFDMQIRNKTGLTVTIVMLVVAFVYIILPLDRIIQYINPENFKMAQKTYDEVKHTFKDTYHSEHPICKIIYAEKHKKNMLSKGLSIDPKSSLRTIFLDDFSGQDDPYSIMEKNKLKADSV